MQCHDTTGVADYGKHTDNSEEHNFEPIIRQFLRTGVCTPGREVGLSTK